MHPHSKLKKEFDHLQKRLWQLFELGQVEEHRLETAVANAWKQFGEMSEMANIEDIKTRALQMRAIMLTALEEHKTKMIIENNQPIHPVNG